jgi:hypothetical protein
VSPTEASNTYLGQSGRQEAGHTGRRRGHPKIVAWLGFGVDETINEAEVKATEALEEALKAIATRQDEDGGGGDRQQNRVQSWLGRSRAQAHDVKPELQKVKVLHLRKQHYLERRATLHGLTNVFALAGFACVIAVPLLLVLSAAEPAGVVAAYAVICLLALALSRHRFRELDDEVLKIDQEFDRIKAIIQNPHRKALKLFQNHSLELRRYYGQVLRHASFIFWVGIACIVLGFGVVGVALWLLTTSELPSDTDKIVGAILGLAGGVLANFVGVIYLRMYSATIGSLNTFHSRLVETHHLHFANFLAAHVEHINNREQTLAQMALKLSVSRPGDEQATAGPSAEAPGAKNGLPAGVRTRFGKSAPTS